jgi:hypothetical protein
MQICIVLHLSYEPDCDLKIEIEIDQTTAIEIETGMEMEIAIVIGTVVIFLCRTFHRRTAHRTLNDMSSRCVHLQNSHRHYDISGGTFHDAVELKHFPFEVTPFGDGHQLTGECLLRHLLRCSQSFRPSFRTSSHPC